MFLSNFHFLRFAQKGRFQAVKFFLTGGQTDRPTDLFIEAPCRSLKILIISNSDFRFNFQLSISISNFNFLIPISDFNFQFQASSENQL